MISTPCRGLHTECEGESARSAPPPRVRVLPCILYGRRSTPSNQYGRSWSLPVPHVFCMGAPYISPETGRLHVLPYLILGVPRHPYKIHVRTWRTPSVASPRDLALQSSRVSLSYSSPTTYGERHANTELGTTALEWCPAP